ncbi:unnamed protein product [Pieris brassicae]|uniref:Uncharacterized protein n=1 Tax=Pieris brassicae TaxID=7116 RepID=A0A9P0TPC0_PIEBR|nr:unnamed protein product [Pieris brassicae]
MRSVLVIAALYYLSQKNKNRRRLRAGAHCRHGVAWHGRASRGMQWHPAACSGIPRRAMASRGVPHPAESPATLVSFAPRVFEVGCVFAPRVFEVGCVAKEHFVVSLWLTGI